MFGTLSPLPVIDTEFIPKGINFRLDQTFKRACSRSRSHMAMLLGAARLLQHQHESAKDGGGLPGTVKLVFQPFEEGGAGADLMIKTGE